MPVRTATLARSSSRCLRVTSTDDGNVEDPDQPTNGDNGGNTGGNQGGNTGGGGHSNEPIGD